jgi:hypothetical protein
MSFASQITEFKNHNFCPLLAENAKCKIEEVKDAKRLFNNFDI